MGWRYLDSACAKSFINESVCDYLQFAFDYRQYYFFSYKLLISPVPWIDCNSNVTKHGLRPCRRHNYPSLVFALCSLLFKRVPHIIQLPFDIHVRRLFIRQRCLAPRAPVNNVIPSINKAFVVKPSKCLQHSL